MVRVRVGFRVVVRDKVFSASTSAFNQLYETQICKSEVRILP